MPARALPWLAAVLFCLAFTACGGGGGGGGGGPVASAPAPGGGSPPDSGGGGTPAPGGGGSPPDSGGGSPAPEPVPPTGQAFRGENALETKLSGAALSGRVGIIDGSCDDVDSGHCDRVQQVMADIDVPSAAFARLPTLAIDAIGVETTYWRYRLFNDDAYASLRPELRVVVMPVGAPFDVPGTAAAVDANNVLFIASAGNTPVAPATGLAIPERRDLYTSSAPEWAVADALPWGVAGHSSLKETLDTLRTGKALVVVWANVNSEGEVVPYAPSVMCGDAAEWCLATVLPPGSRSGSTGTSFAAPIVGAAAYYLFQLWSQAEDVASTLKACALDIGAPGTDREFGVGALNVDCPEVETRERMAVRASLKTEMRSPYLDSHGASGPHSPSASGPVFGFTENGGVSDFLVPKMYLSDRYRAVGATLPFASGELIGIWGRGTSPLGVSSSLAPVAETSFVEVGFAKGLSDSVEGNISLVGAYGVSSGGIDATAGRLGLKFERESADASFSLYAGVLRAGAKVGVPGRREVGRPRVSVSDDSLETRARYALRF